jgi:hypothetical protein
MFSPLVIDVLIVVLVVAAAAAFLVYQLALRHTRREKRETKDVVLGDRLKKAMDARKDRR